jgi:hypothetical protein
MSSLVKIPLMVAAAFGAWHALTPPQPPAGARERVKVDGLERSFGRIVRIHAMVWKVRLALGPEHPDTYRHDALIHTHV